MSTTSNFWKKYLNKYVELIINDTPYPRSRTGLLVDIDDTHVFLQSEYSDEPIPYARSTIKRVTIKNESKG